MRDAAIVAIVGTLTVGLVLFAAILCGYNHTLQTLGIGAICALCGVGYDRVRRTPKTIRYLGSNGSEVKSQVIEKTD